VIGGGGLAALGLGAGFTSGCGDSVGVRDTALGTLT
jgi:hypothetical protein